MSLPTLAVRAVTARDRDLLDVLVRNEAVVPVESPRDLDRRLAHDRRVLAVLHPDGAPLAFVHVALTAAFPRTLDDVLAGPVAPPDATVRFATFYGITRVDERARGQAGALLAAGKAHILDTVPGVQVAATLSPMPGFRAWVGRTLDASGHPGASAELDGLARSVAAGLAPPHKTDALRRLARLWLSVRDARGRLKDPVARFHLGNGAVVRDVLVSADCSWHGLEQSLGVMMSYQYVPAASDLDASSAEPADPFAGVCA